MLGLMCSNAGGNVVNGCVYGSLCNYVCRGDVWDGIIFSVAVCIEDRAGSFVVLCRRQENVPRCCRRIRQCYRRQVFRYINVNCVDLGVAVSYLIIIGDLMPQVIGSVFPGSKAMPFLLDRQFWITTFM